MSDGLLHNLIREDRPESPQLLTLILAAIALVGGMAATIVACAWRILTTGTIGWGAVWAFLFAVSALGILAGYAQRFQLPSLPVGAGAPSSPACSAQVQGGGGDSSEVQP